MYRCYIVENNQIYWSKDSLDKPSKRCFDEIERRLDWILLANSPNFVSEFICELVLDKETYNYMKLVNQATGETTYWFNAGVSKVLNNDHPLVQSSGYVVRYEMDIFSSYTYGVIPYYMNKGFPITVNRSTYLPFQAIPYVYTLDDELLPPFREYTKIPLFIADSVRQPLETQPKLKKIYKPQAKIKMEFGLEYRYDKVGLVGSDYFVESGEYTLLWNTGGWDVEQDKYKSIYIRHKSDATDLYMEVYKGDSVVCDVFLDKGCVILLPLNVKFSGTLASMDGENIATETINDADTAEYTIVNLIKNTTLFSKQYKGRFLVPNFHELASASIRVLKIAVYSKRLLFMFYAPFTSDYLYSRSKPIIFNDNHTSNLITTNSTTLSPYVQSKYRQVSNNTPWNNRSWLYDNQWMDGGYNYIYDAITGYSILGKNAPYNFWNVVFRGYETAPTTISDYSQFRQSQQAQLSTGMNNAIAQGVIGAYTGFAGGAASLILGNDSGYLGGITRGVDSIVNLASYSETQKALLRDKKMSNTDKTIYSTSEHSLIVNKYAMNSYTRYSNSVCSIYVKGYNNAYDIRNSNKIVWENGMKVGSIDFTLDDINEIHLETVSGKRWSLPDTMDVDINSFIYWDWNFNINYIKEILPALKQSLILKIADTLNRPVRFWNNGYAPDYTDTSLDNRHRVDYTAGIWVDTRSAV